MRRNRAFRGGRAGSIILAGFLGYVLGGWNVSTLRNTSLSAAQTVALRFPQDWGDAADVTAATTVSANTMDAAAKGVPQLALLSPEPMVAHPSIPQPSAPQTSIPELAVSPVALQTAAVEQAAPTQPTLAATRIVETKPAAAPVHHLNDRPGFVLNDAQIASIKQRLHLTMDQEQMWPAVEAALRNIAYMRARETRHGAPANTAQVAAADPNSAEVQGLKSAAIPLLMSFDSEQKDEVRSLAHVMGLDQLASQF
jgi:hypothetical protein